MKFLEQNLEDMIFRRVGSKNKIADKLQALFPFHKVYIEPFFGRGGMFFNKPKSPFNIVNDTDSDVFNLFQVVMDQKKELQEAFRIMPIHQDLLNYWKQNKETDPIRKALRFLFLSNFTYLGKMGTIRYSLRSNDKELFYKNIERTFIRLEEVRFNNCDFRKFFKCLSHNDVDFGKPSGERDYTFFYNDPPYLSTINTYNDSDKWTKQDSIDLFDCLQATKCKFAYSEFNNPFILRQVKERGLNVHIIGERQNLKNRRVEILVTNYQNAQTKLF